MVLNYILVGCPCLSLKVVGNSVMAATYDTSDGVPGTKVFLACWRAKPRAAKNSSGSLFKLDRNRKPRYKSLSHPGYAKASVNFFLKGNSVFQPAMQQWLLDKLKRCFPSGLELLRPYYFQPCSRGSRLFQEKEREK